MKRIITPLLLLLIALLLFVGKTQAQGPAASRSPKWEIGIEAIRVDQNSKRSMTGRYMNLIQPMPGFYVRRMMNRFSVRAGIQMGRLYFGERDWTMITPSTLEIKAFSIGFYSGASFQPFKKAGWLQLIGDLSWQRLHARTSSNNLSTRITYTSDLYQNELFLRIGLNPRVPISRHLCIGTELTLGRGVRVSKYEVQNQAIGNNPENPRTEDSRFHPMANLVVAARF